MWLAANSEARVLIHERSQRGQVSTAFVFNLRLQSLRYCGHHIMESVWRCQMQVTAWSEYHMLLYSTLYFTLGSEYLSDFPPRWSNHLDRCRLSDPLK